jgi:hypothetical protein
MPRSVADRLPRCSPGGRSALFCRGYTEALYLVDRSREGNAPLADALASLIRHHRSDIMLDLTHPGASLEKYTPESEWGGK